jgi:hypothetical protein
MRWDAGRRGAGRNAGLCFGTVLLAGDFRDVDFFVVGFFAAGRFATIFFATTFFTACFWGGRRFDAAFFAAVFLGVARFRVAFAVADFFLLLFPARAVFAVDVPRGLPAPRDEPAVFLFAPVPGRDSVRFGPLPDFDRVRRAAIKDSAVIRSSCGRLGGRPPSRWQGLQSVPSGLPNQ